MSAPTVSELSYIQEERTYFRGDAWADSCFRLASFVTDPVCKVDELYARLFVEDTGYGGVQAALLGTQMIGYGALSLVGGPMGLMLRTLGCYLQKTPFRFIETGTSPKKLEANRFSLLSWNICCVGGGYSITDGGVPPWPSRIDAIAQTIIDKNADVVCLYETFDYNSAIILTEKLKGKGYTHIYRNIGPRPLGVSSGIFVASKFETADPNFEPFSIETLVGRTKNATKGVFSFSLKSEGTVFAKIYATHPQHSGEPASPKEEETLARAAQMDFITKKMIREIQRGVCSIITGDLNLDDREYEQSSWKDYFNKGVLFFKEKRTWGGDTNCAKLGNCHVLELGKAIQAFFNNLFWGTSILETLGSIDASGPLNLDHTAILKITGGTLETSLVETHFDHTIYRRSDEQGRPILSDHQGLFSNIILPQSSKL